ncbi:MAG: transposase [Planctomycetaceae bacterium]|nr:transposase [Planctomycetaceae bacterium]
MPTNEYDPKIHHRHSIRLRGYDYSKVGYYFITICTHYCQPAFGNIEKGFMVLNNAGNMIERWWKEVSCKFPNVQTDLYVIMPNHFHGIINIIDTKLNAIARPNTKDKLVGADLRVCPENKNGEHIDSPLQHTPISKIVQWYKTMTTNEYIRNVKQNDWKPFKGTLWQRNYYEHIIRNEISLGQIREYILKNPSNWEDDELFQK